MCRNCIYLRHKNSFFIIYLFCQRCFVYVHGARVICLRLKKAKLASLSLVQTENRTFSSLIANATAKPQLSQPLDAVPITNNGLISRVICSLTLTLTHTHSSIWRVAQSRLNSAAFVCQHRRRVCDFCFEINRRTYTPYTPLHSLFMSCICRLWVYSTHERAESDAHKFIDKIAALTLWHSLIRELSGIAT